VDEAKLDVQHVVVVGAKTAVGVTGAPPPKGYFDMSKDQLFRKVRVFGIVVVGAKTTVGVTWTPPKGIERSNVD
jgi:hypothetical protein